MNCTKIKSYFYIIKHKSSGILYCGARWKNGCHPDELLTENGYTTSQKIINELISKEGIQCFEIITIITFDSTQGAREFETKFQTLNECAQSESWYNEHNGMGLSDWLKTRNISSAMQIPEIQKIQAEKQKQTLMKKYGVDHIMKVPHILYKSLKSGRKTLLEKYGVDHNFKIPDVIEKIKETRKDTWLEKYGVENVMQNPEIQKKQRKAQDKTISEKYGVQNVSQLESTQLKIKENSLAKHGVQHYTKQDQYKKKQQAILLEKHGVTNPGQTEKSRKQSAENMRKAQEIRIECPHCGKTGNLGNMKRWHYDNCKLKNISTLPI